MRDCGIGQVSMLSLAIAFPKAGILTIRRKSKDDDGQYNLCYAQCEDCYSRFEYPHLGRSWRKQEKVIWSYCRAPVERPALYVERDGGRVCVS